MPDRWAVIKKDQAKGDLLGQRLDHFHQGLFGSFNWLPAHAARGVQYEHYPFGTDGNPVISPDLFPLNHLWQDISQRRKVKLRPIFCPPDFPFSIIITKFLRGEPRQVLDHIMLDESLGFWEQIDQKIDGFGLADLRERLNQGPSIPKMLVKLLRLG